jgi:protein translocase SecG subunit
MLDIILILNSIILIFLILIQERGTLGGSIFGGFTEIFFHRRGLESLLFKLTWAFIILFVVFSIARIL